jgi:hypothetical protein
LPLFSEDEEDTPKRPKKAKKVGTPRVVSDVERSPSPTIDPASPSPEVQAVEPSSGRHWKCKGASAVAELDQTPQEITKHGYSEHAFLLNSMIYIGVSCLMVSHVVVGPDRVFDPSETS